MKLSISNIAWDAAWDLQVYEYMHRYGYSGLEIAPTRIFPQNPYDRNAEAGDWKEQLKRDFGIVVSSMQSIWFGRTEKVFASKKEREILIDYTKKAVDFAESVGCKNLVFGCPGNRSIREDTDYEIGVKFFRKLGEYAVWHGTVIGMEANPPMYNTNYINDTSAALELIERVDSKGFRLNLDVGTMIENGESADDLEGRVGLIHHVHISEPGLKPIEERELHINLKRILDAGGYRGFVSIEMGKVDDIQIIENKMKYVRSVFG